MEDDKVFALDMGFGKRLNVYVSGQPEDYLVTVSDPDQGATIVIDKCDWLRIVERVAAQF